MEKKELSTLMSENVINTVTAADKLFMYSASGAIFGFAPATAFLRQGYACRRWSNSAASPIGEAYGNLDYLRDLPGLLGLGCYLVDSNRNFRKLDPTNHYKFANGDTAALDGTMGQYMWCWNKHYYAEWDESGYHYEAVSLNPIPGRMNYTVPTGGISALGNGGVIDRTDLKLVSVINSAARYRGGNNDSTKDSAYNTQLGRVATSYDVATAMTYARKHGEGWSAGWYSLMRVPEYLFRIIFGTRNVQTAYNSAKDSDGLYQGGLGAGVTNAGSWWSDSAQFNYYPFLPTSAAVDMADACGVKSYAVNGSDGSTLQTVTIPVFFGLKNFFGYIGLIEGGSQLVAQSDGTMKMYVADSMYDGYTPGSITGCTAVGTIPAVSAAGGFYISKQTQYGMAATPTELSGSSSTYYCDYMYHPAITSGFRACIRRGNAGSGVSAGLAYLDGYCGVSNSSADFGVPLCVAKEDPSPVPFLAV